MPCDESNRVVLRLYLAKGLGMMGVPNRNACITMPSGWYPDVVKVICNWIANCHRVMREMRLLHGLGKTRD